MLNHRRVYLLGKKYNSLERGVQLSPSEELELRVLQWCSRKLFGLRLRRDSGHLRKLLREKGSK